MSWSCASIPVVSSSSSWGCELKCWSAHAFSPSSESSSSWGCELKCRFCCESGRSICHPPREDVSWNIREKVLIGSRSSSSSSWGCELKYIWTYISRWETVSSSSWGCELKYWDANANNITTTSSSSWGCELKCHLLICLRRPLWSSSSWGCELKFHSDYKSFSGKRHPPREDVSWNVDSSLLVCCLLRHPPREDVSWNTSLQSFAPVDLSSSSSWGCELKYNTGHTFKDWAIVILLVRMWVEMQIVRRWMERT